MKKAFALLSIFILSGCTGYHFNQNTNLLQQSLRDQGLEGEKLNVALLLPISGSNADIGKTMLDATQLALTELKAEHVDLEPIDTGNTPEKADEMMKKLSAKKYDLIVGPVFSNQTKLVYSYAYQNMIPMISFSNDVSLQGHAGLFLIGFMPNQQIERVVRYSKENGFDKIFALLPNNRYGMLVERTLIDKSSRYGYVIVETAKYSVTKDGDMTSLNAAVAMIKSAMTKEAMIDQEATTRFALLLPEGGKLVKEIMRDMSTWAEQNHVRFKFLGSSQWDDEELIDSEYTNGAWIASAPVNEIKDFEKKFYYHFGYKPFKIAAIAYDAMALATVLSNQTSISNNMLKDPKGFQGISGIFRFKEDGSNERALSIFEIQNSKLMEIDPAGKSF